MDEPSISRAVCSWRKREASVIASFFERRGLVGAVVVMGLLLGGGLLLPRGDAIGTPCGCRDVHEEAEEAEAGEDDDECAPAASGRP